LSRGGVGGWGLGGLGVWGNGQGRIRGCGGRKIKRIGGGWEVGTLVLGGPISIGVSSGGGAPWLETMRGVPPALITVRLDYIISKL